MPRGSRKPHPGRGVGGLPSAGFVALSLLIVVACTPSVEVVEVVQKGQGGASSGSSGSGTKPACDVDADCGPAGTPCHTLFCKEGKCTIADLPVGAPCSDGGVVCDGNGNCVADHCADSVHDATEADVDCGGDCPPCATGKKCASAKDCTSGYCAPDARCHACDVDWKCGPGHYCEGLVCAEQKNLGVVCAAGGECASGFCVEGFCCDAACAGPCAHCAMSKGAAADGFCHVEFPKHFAGVVSNSAEPAKPGKGFGGLWVYGGLIGVPAGNAMCKAIGANHVCDYAEVLKADAAGELNDLPAGVSYWLHRTTNVPNVFLNNKACNTDAECGGASVCDPAGKICAWKAGAGGRCVDWTIPGGDLGDGEWFEVFQNGGAFNGGGLKSGSLVFHFDADAGYDGTNAHSCQNPAKLGCSGPCGGVTRAILCCLDACS